MRIFLMFGVVLLLEQIGMSQASKILPSQEESFAGAFAEAQAEFQNRCNLYLEQARVEAWYRPWGAVGFSVDLLTAALEMQHLAEKLAKEHGKAISPYLLKLAMEETSKPFSPRSRETRLLALLTLDELGLYDGAAELSVELAFRERPSYSSSPCVWILLEVSFCSEKTREAAANLLAQRLLEVSPRRLPEIPTLDFLAAAGNERTIELLKKRTQQLEEEFNRAAEEKDKRGRPRWLKEQRIEWQQKLRRPYEQVVARIQSKLSLPEKEREQRTKDELLFMQTRVGAPRPVNLDAGLKYAIDCLAFQKLSVSTDFLIEQLKNAKAWNKETPHESQANWNRVHLALMFIASQKENGAVPAMVDLARRAPEFQQQVKKTLGQLGSSEAKEALLILEASKKM